MWGSWRCRNASTRSATISNARSVFDCYLRRTASEYSADGAFRLRQRARRSVTRELLRAAGIVLQPLRALVRCRMSQFLQLHDVLDATEHIERFLQQQ